MIEDSIRGSFAPTAKLEVELDESANVIVDLIRAVNNLIKRVEKLEKNYDQKS